MKEKMLVFIPSYNCEKQIVRVLNQFNKDILTYIDEIIIVNNRSTDDTEAMVINWIKNHDEIPIKLFRNKQNYGLGGSHKIAFNYAIENNYDYIVVLHGDDQGQISDFLPLLKSEKYKEYDCCLGARFMKGSILEGYSKTRIWGNCGFNALFSLVAGKKIYDLGSGLNLYKVATLNPQSYSKYPDTLYFNDCMILASCHFKQNVFFYPISWREEDQISNNKIIKFAWSLLKMLGNYVIYREKYLLSDMRNIEVDKYEADIIYKNGGVK